MRPIAALASSLTLLVALAGAAKAADPEPQIFAPEVVSGPANDGSPTFSPDGHTLYFTRSGAIAGTILESHARDGGWTTPEIAPFSGQWNDEHPSMSPDGRFLVFVSTRPLPGVVDKTAHRVAHIWRVDRTATGWSEPVHLPETINFGDRMYAPSVAADGTLYFLNIGEGRTFQLYRSRYINGAYATAEKLSFSSPATADVDPEIAPDQSYCFFASAGRRTGDTKEHLYVVFAKGDGWGEPVALHYTGDGLYGGSTDNEPNLGPGAHTLYFSSDRSMKLTFPRTREQAVTDLARISAWDNGNSNAWSLPIDAWLAEQRQAVNR